MKPLSLLLSLGISLPMFPALAQPPALPRCNPNGNQLEMNACADQAREEADFELNSVYLEIQRRHAGDALFLENLSEAQGAGSPSAMPSWQHSSPWRLTKTRVLATARCSGYVTPEKQPALPASESHNSGNGSTVCPKAVLAVAPDLQND